MNPVWRAILLAVLVATVGGGTGYAEEAERDFLWPPVVGQEYPDFELLDQAGKSVRLSKFKGRVILVEPFAMNCPACQAFLGANRKNIGPLGPITPQDGLASVEELFLDYSGVRLPNSHIIYVNLLLFDLEGDSPCTVEDANRVVQHFKLRRADNEYILVADERFVGQISFDMIPGFHLIDRHFILRADSTGHEPRDNMYTTLLPMVKRLL